MSEVEVDSRALLPEDVTESADMNLRKQIYRVVMRYIELPPKDHSGHDEDGVVVIDFICKCIDQRPQSFIEGDYDVDCDFLQWLLSSCCLIMSKSSQIININLINCLTKLFQALDDLLRSLSVLRIVEQHMQLDDETTAIQLQKILTDNGHPLSLKTILKSRDRLGWMFHGNAYCQMIRQANKEKRYCWAQNHLDDAVNNSFENVLWTDESSIMPESHKHFCCRKRATAPKPKPRAKHPVKVHVWAGISCKGKTPIVFIEGKMNAIGFIEVLNAGLVPYLNKVDSSPRFMQDNDPKHSSRRVASWMASMGINWWKTLAESPDLTRLRIFGMS